MKAVALTIVVLGDEWERSVDVEREPKGHKGENKKTGLTIKS